MLSYEPARLDGELLGRVDDLRRLVGVLPGAERSAAVVILLGEPGIGKTALLATAAADARGRGMSVLRATGVESEAALPFAGLHQCLRPVLQYADMLAARQRAALLTAFGMADGDAPDIFLVALATLELLADAGRRAPVLVAVDDAHWLDTPSCQVLVFIARRIEDEPVAFVATLREGYDSPLVDAELPIHRLSALDDVASARLLDRHGDGIRGTSRRRVLAQACGNPLALVELAASAREAGSDGAAIGDSELALTARLERAFARRAAALPGATQVALLAAAAADDSDLPVGDVLAVTHELGPKGSAEDPLAPAVRARLIETPGGGVRFRHPLVRSAIYQSANPEQRRATHAALAHRFAADADRHAWHSAAAASGHSEAIAQSLVQAAGRAQARGAVAVAVRATERAAELTPDPALRSARLLDAAELAFQLGQRDRVTGLLARVDEHVLAPASLARAALIQESFDDGRPGDPNAVMALIVHADEMREAGETDIALGFLRGAALRTWWADPGEPVRDAVVGAAERFRGLERDPRLVAALSFAGPFVRGRIVIERVEASIDLARTDPAVAHLLGLAAHAVGHNALALRLLTPAVAKLRSQGRFALLAQLLGLVAWDAIALGDWDTASEAAIEGTRLAHETSQPVWGAGTGAGVAFVDGIRGRADAARGAIDAAEAFALPARLQAQLCVAQTARGVTAMSEGHHVAAYAHLRRVFDHADVAFHQVDRLVAISYYAEAAAHSGKPEEALVVLAELEHLTDLTPSPALHLGVAHARAFLADDEHKEPLVHAALAVDQAPFPRARLELEYGRWLRRQRRAADSRAPLRTAENVFAALRARPWAEQARRELRASGERTRRRTAETRDELTPQEWQIARLAAEGMTNREIGEHLYLSHRTVASHLYRVFPKLGITSRAQLSSTLASREGIDPTQDPAGRSEPTVPD
jgi:DNA-binding CsgD family transcriptional regulator